MTKLTWNGRFISNAAQRAALDALKDGAEHMITAATPHVPLLSGTLRRSATVTVINSTGTRLKVTVSYNTPYALRQHEDMNLRHSVGGPKYLENTFNSEQSNVQEYIKAKVKAAIEAGR